MMDTNARRRLVLVAVVPLVLVAARAAPLEAQGALRVVSGVEADGDATETWLEILRRRLPDEPYAAAAAIRHHLTPEEKAWADLIRSRVAEWERQIPAVARPYRPASGPDTAVIVVGNRGASDAFTHDARTIGFDLAALQSEYGDAALPDNTDRIDRLFRHEYAHVLQKAWLPDHPYAMDTPLRLALIEIWKEGLGNYHSMSERWRSKGGKASETAARTLAILEPRFVARLAAIACAPPEQAAALKADLSWGRFDRKWGALVPALWLDAEADGDPEALRAFIQAGPDGVWELAERHLSEELQAVMREVRLADGLCRGQ